MTKLRLRLWLPIGQLVLALALSLIGRAQTQHRTAGNILIWDYIAPAEMILHAINYPAALAVGLATRHHTFQIGIEYSISAYLAYLLCIVILWYVIGAAIEKPWLRRKRTRSTLSWMCICCLLGGACLLVAFSMLNGPYGWLLVASAFLWSGLFLGAFTILCLAWRHGSALPM